MATAPHRSGFAETSSSRRVLGSPLWYSVGPWPAILGWTRNWYSSSSVQPVELGRELTATEEHAGRGRVLELVHARAQITGEVVAAVPREVLARRRDDVLRLGVQLDGPLAQRRWRLLVAAGDCAAAHGARRVLRRSPFVRARRSLQRGHPWPAISLRCRGDGVVPRRGTPSLRRSARTEVRISSRCAGDRPWLRGIRAMGSGAIRNHER
jgi:hypothetical protein